MSYTTYSFSDTIIVLTHPAVGSYTFTGQGIAEVVADYITENTAHALGADGSVMISKIKADNGNIGITVQQTSNANQWLQHLFNFLMGGPTLYWAQAIIHISSPLGTGDNIICSGVSPAKRATRPFQQQGQNITWPFMAASIQGQGVNVLQGINLG